LRLKIRRRNRNGSRGALLLRAASGDETLEGDKAVIPDRMFDTTEADFSAKRAFSDLPEPEIHLA